MKKKIKNIITVQHTESIHHTNGMIGSWTDWALSDMGKQQATRIAGKLSAEISGKDYILFSSTLLRAKQTAGIIGEHLEIDTILTPALMERNLGAAVGKSVQWLKENIEQEEKTIDDRCFHDAESRRDVWNRLLPFYEEILNSEQENILLVSHGDTLSIFNAMWLGLSPEFLNHADLYGNSGGVSFLHRNESGKRIIKRLSDMSYVF